MSDIKTALKSIISLPGEVYSLVGTVVAVDDSKRVCDVEPINGDAIIYDVRLQAAQEKEDGIVLIPAQGSEVIVTFLGPNDGYVAQRTIVDKILIVIEGQTLEYTKKGLSLFSEEASMAEQLEAMLLTLGKLIDTLLQFQLATNVGPTVSVMPQIVTLLNQHKLDFQKVNDKIKTFMY